MSVNPAAVPDWSPFNTASSGWAQTLAAAMRSAPTFVQPILPGWTFNINSNNSAAPQTEVEVLQQYSYGRQLGRIADALSALIEKVAPDECDAPAYKPFMEMTRTIAAMKNDAAVARIDQLRADLLMLRATGSEDYDRIKQSLRRTLEL